MEIKMLLNLNNKNALIGGSSQGIGRAIAEKYANAGANLLLLARSEEKLQNLISTLPNNGSQIYDYAVVDYENTIDLQKIVQAKLKKFVSFDIIINNTGGPAPGAAHTANIDAFLKGLKIHLIAYQSILQICLDKMKEKNFGRIINITSVGAKQPVDNLGVSNAVRGAVSSWAKILSKELAPFGITVNNILPGFIDTERLQSLFENISKSQNISFDDVRANKIKEIPAGRLGSAEEIANAALFLASEQAAYINGINLPVDGGLLRTL
jgi:3-oxoacyl-[acyl-carrier protein] reductase